MKKILIAATFALLTSVSGAFAQEAQPVAPQAQQPAVVEQQPAQPVAQAPDPATECEVAAPAPKKAAKQKRKARPCNIARPARASAPAVVQKVEPVTNVQTIVEKTIIRRIIVNEPTIYILSPPTVVRQPACVRCAPRPASVCGPRPCPGQHATVAPGQPGVGYVPGAPQNAEECTQRGGQVVNDGRSCQGYR